MTLGENHHNWKGGKYKSKAGYIFIYKPNHPFVNKKVGKGYISEHRLVMEKKLGRYLKPNEIIHHIDRNRNNNKTINLQLMTRKRHSQLHLLGRKLSEKTKQKISKANKGRIVSELTKKKLSLAGKGRIMSIETRKKMSLAQKGRKVSKKTRKKISLKKRGKKLLEETKKKISLTMQKEVLNRKRNKKGKFIKLHQRGN